MTETMVRRTHRGPAIPKTVEALHDKVDRLWDEADFIALPDRMAFTLAVVEAAENVVDHARPATPAPVERAVELTATPERLEARIYEIGATPAHPDLDLEPVTKAGELAESGRGLALIRALVSTVVFQRHGTTNMWVLRRDCHTTSSSSGAHD